jgi:hypothetical protein
MYNTNGDKNIANCQQYHCHISTQECILHLRFPRSWKGIMRCNRKSNTAIQIWTCSSIRQDMINICLICFHAVLVLFLMLTSIAMARGYRLFSFICMSYVEFGCVLLETLFSTTLESYVSLIKVCKYYFTNIIWQGDS